MRTQASKKSTAAQATPALSQADWLTRFADCLMLLHPHAVAVTVARHVAAHSAPDSELPPEEAAMKFMFDQPMDEVGIPH